MELVFLRIVALASVAVAVMLAYSLSKPYLNAVDSYMDTISRVERAIFCEILYREKIPERILQGSAEDLMRWSSILKI